jgi:hypothetical protein
VQGWQAIRAKINAARPDKNGYRERPGLFVCENVRSFFRTVIILPRDFKGNPEDIPKNEHLEDHAAELLRYRLRHVTVKTFTSRRHN